MGMFDIDFKYQSPSSMFTFPSFDLSQPLQTLLPGFLVAQQPDLQPILQTSGNWGYDLFKNLLQLQGNSFMNTLNSNNNLSDAFATTLNLKKESAFKFINLLNKTPDYSLLFLSNTLATKIGNDLTAGAALSQSSNNGTSLVGNLIKEGATTAIKEGVNSLTKGFLKGSTVKGGGLKGAIGNANPALMQGIGQGLDIINSALGDRAEYSGKYGSLARGLDTAYDTASDALMSSGNPYGMAAGAAMKLNGALSKGVGKLGGGTDGMCVCAGTKVYTASGRITTIELLLKEDGIIGWNESTKLIVPLSIHDFIEPREKECLEIELKSGLILRCSTDHPILSDISEKAKIVNVNGKRIGVRLWKFRPASELKVGNFVGMANDVNYWGNIELPNAYLVGMLIGDGTYTEGNSCRLWTADPSTWEYIESNNLGVINNCNGKDKDKYKSEIRTYRIINGMSLMRSLGIVYLKSDLKTLPKDIWKYDRDSICKLIAGLFDTDGSISVNEDTKKFSITFYQTNLNLIKELKSQLYKLGIIATINIRKAADYNIGGKIRHSKQSYRLEIKRKQSVIRFYENIPLNISYKKKNLEKIYNIVLNKKDSEYNLISGAIQSKIVRITPIGILTVYNLLADDDHTYLAEDIITHNTSTDAILGSAWMLMTPFGLINGFGGKRADTITADEDTRANVGTSYGGTFDKVDDALTKSGKKYGLFSSSARKKANEEIAEAKRQQFLAADISENAQNLFNIQGSMSAINDNRRAYLLQGGWADGSIVFGRKGTKLPEEKITFEEEPIITFEEELVEKFEEGGKFNVIPEGALHARKHNIDIDGITKKGIPVVSEDENGKVELQAEVEVNEIILRLELTKKLEELSRMDSDKSAIEAGKLLVDEILNNTVDNTNLILETK